MSKVRWTKSSSDRIRKPMFFIAPSSSLGFVEIQTGIGGGHVPDDSKLENRNWAGISREYENWPRWRGTLILRDEKNSVKGTQLILERKLGKNLCAPFIPGIGSEVAHLSGRVSSPPLDDCWKRSMNDKTREGGRERRANIFKGLSPLVLD